MTDLILYSVLPLFLLFMAERLGIYAIRKSKNKKKLREVFWLHPNLLTYFRYPMGFVSVLLYAEVSKPLGIFWFGLWMISDVTDGSLARHLNLETVKGKSIDPLSDKLLYFPPLFYGVYLGFFELQWVLIYLVMDISGQVSRFFVRETAANLFGKTKTFLTVMTLMVPFVQETYFGAIELPGANLFLIVTCLLSFCSFFFRTIPNYWYANILSILNLLCGISGIVIVLMNGQDGLKIAFALVFLGQFLDLFDGRAAERWGSPPWGEILDDLADGTNFGGTIAIIIFYTFENFFLALALATLHLVFTVYRLIRFLNDKKTLGVTTGVSVFNGLPSPGAALFTGSSMILFANPMFSVPFDKIYLQVGAVVLGALLMISHIPYIHVGRSLLPKIPKFFRVLAYALILVLIVITFRVKTDFYVFMSIFAFSVLYLLFGINFSMIGRKNNSSQ